MLSQAYNIIVDRGVSVTGHDREVVYGFNFTDKRFLFQLIKNVQLYGTKKFGTEMVIRSQTHNFGVSLAPKIKAYLSNASHKNQSLIKVNTKNGQVNRSGQKGSIVCRSLLMLRTNLKKNMMQQSFCHCSFLLNTQNRMECGG